jgi:hypothetical protein
MAESFASKVSELESALALVESSLRGAELARVRALVSALLEVHRLALQDVRRVVGDAELGRAAAAEPSVAWVLACHDIDASVLERAVSSAEAKQARAEQSAAPAPSFIPISRLLKRQGAPTP